MKTIFQLSQLQLKFLFQQKSFLYAALILIVFALFMIPGADSNYTTYYISKMTGYPDAFWVSSLGSILINIILSFVGFFFLEGSCDTEKKSGLGALARVSAISNHALVSVKWISYVIVLSSLVLMGMVCLFVVNYDSFNPLVFLRPFVYFNLPYMLFLSALILVFDYGIRPRVIKISCYLLLVTLICVANRSAVMDVMGFNEFNQNIGQQVFSEEELGNHDFGMGYMLKSKDFGYFNLDPIVWKEHFVYKLGLGMVSILLVLLFSLLFDRYKPRLKKGAKTTALEPASVGGETKLAMRKLAVNKISNWAVLSPEIKVNFYNLVVINWLVFRSCFTKIKGLTFLAFWICGFLVNLELCHNLIVPILFLFGFSLLEKMIHLVNKETIQVYFATGMHTRVQYALVSFIFLLSFFMLCSIPAFYFLDLNGVIMSMLRITLLAGVLVAGISSFKTLKIWEVGYMCLFGSYLAGSKIWMLF